MKEVIALIFGPSSVSTSSRGGVSPGPPAGQAGCAGEAVPMPCVYLLRCSDGSLYCGWTTDIGKRVAAHGAGTASRYTRSRRPVELAGLISVADRSEALREEARIKRLPRTDKLRLIETLSIEPTV